jgi:hypothetical protein
MYKSIIITMLLSFNAQASYVQIDDNHFIWDDGDGDTHDVFLSPLDNSCRYTIPVSCTTVDVGQVTYATAQAIPNLMTADRMTQLFSEGIFDDTIVKGGYYWVVDETPNPYEVFKPIFNAYYGYESTGSGAFYYATETVSAVPVPASLWLFGSGLIGIAGVARRFS